MNALRVVKAKIAMPRRRIKGAIVGRKELNYVDTAITNKAFATGGGTVTLVNGIAEGDDNTDRNGRQVSIKSFQFHGVAASPTAHAGQMGRALLVWDNAPNGVVATIANIFTSDDGNAFPLVNNEKRFTILADIPLTFGTSVSTATQAISDQNTQVLNFYRKINSNVEFNGTGATIASIQNGALYLCTIGTGANTCNLNGLSRVRFSDK